MIPQEKRPDLAEGAPKNNRQKESDQSLPQTSVNVTSSKLNYGATPDDWVHLDVVLGLTDDLLPVVSDPRAVKSPDSKIQGPGKTPSYFNRKGEMVGFAKWTTHHATPADIGKWSADDRLGICLQTRVVRAIDVDIDDFDEATDVEQFIVDALGYAPPTRRRSNSSKFLMLVDLPGDFSKRRFKTERGVIEFLAGGQQAVLVGTHPSGTRYEFDGGLPCHIPAIDPEQFETFWLALNEKFGTEASVNARKGSTPAKKRQLSDINDPLVDYLDEHGWILDINREGRVDLTCPFDEHHTSDSGDSSTSYFPAGLGGYGQGHFKCQHAHCIHRTDQDFKDAIGWSTHGFDVLPEATPEEEAEQAATRARNEMQAERRAKQLIDRARFKDPTAIERERRKYQKEENKRIGEGEDTIPTAEIVSLETAINRFVFLSDGARVADIFNPHYDLAVTDWRNTYAASKEVFPQEGKPDKEIPVSRLWLESPRRKTAVCRTFKAGGGLVLNDPNGRRALNSWKPFDRSLEVDDLQAARVGIFLDHVDFLFGTDAGRFLDWLAHIEQYPGELPHTAWLHIASNFGMGRNWLASVLTRVWAGSVAANFDLVKTLSSGFNDRLSRKVLATIDEIREGGRDSQWDHSEKMKSLITEEHRTVNIKCGRISVEYNACRFLMFSQHLTALPMEKGDRRIEVVVTDAPPKGPDYYARLYSALSDKYFIAGVATYLGQRDISHFNPGAHAADTTAKQQATAASQTPMAKQCEMLVKFWPGDVIKAADLMGVLERVDDETAKRTRITSSHRRTLEQYGISSKETPIKDDSKTVRLWFVRNKDKWLGASNAALLLEYQKAFTEERGLMDAYSLLDDLAAGVV